MLLDKISSVQIYHVIDHYSPLPTLLCCQQSWNWQSSTLRSFLRISLQDVTFITAVYPQSSCFFIGSKSSKHFIAQASWFGFLLLPFLLWIYTAIVSMMCHIACVVTSVIQGEKCWDRAKWSQTIHRRCYCRVIICSDVSQEFREKNFTIENSSHTNIDTHLLKETRSSNDGRSNRYIG